jgi:S1-C subfamily serine protease
LKNILLIIFLWPLLLLAEEPGGSAMIGINIAGDSAERGPVAGISVLGVSPGGPADQAGLRSGDLLTAIGEQSLAADDARLSRQRLLDFMQRVRPGEDISLAYRRAGQVARVTLKAVAAEPGMPAPGYPWLESLEQLGADVGTRILQPMARQWRYGGWLRGLELVSLSPDLGRYFGVDSGILVVRAPLAEGLSLRDGDVILRIGARTPQDPDHALRILRSYQPGEPLQLEIRREQSDQQLELTVPVDRAPASSGMRFLPGAFRRPSA